MGFQKQGSSLAVPAPPTGAGAYDEAYLPDGSIREHWRYLLGSLQELGPQELGLRRQAIERILRDDGATYNDYSPGLVARPWALDPIPLLIDSREWSSIEAGVRERAELLDLVLRDLYGPRDLLRHGVIPAELVFSDHGFLRECQGIALPGEHQLIQYATDMVRAPDGQVRVISDRTQTPSGAGYALENRQVMSRAFPSLFRDSHVHRLSLYFNRLRLQLQALGPGDEVPTVVVLTPGAFNETYFEHSFLANFLGYPLVQGSDLTVRDGQVWIKTLNGLSRVDVILRRVDDVFCDPVELKPDSRLGIPGLLEVVRNGKVVVVNPLGSGLLENRALARYLPAAARHFLGRELALESVPTYWCGDPADLRYTLDKLNTLVIKTTYRGPASQILRGAELGQTELEDLRRRIIANPLSFVAQQYLPPANVPGWEAGRDTPMPSVLRSFAVADGSSYTVMAGGLTRVGAPAGAIEISNRLGSLSKDTWVLASEPEKQPDGSAAPRGALRERPRGGAEMPSSAVENLYWVGRYTERADSSLRLLRTVFARLDDDQPLSAQSRALLLRGVTQLTCTYPGFMDESAIDASAEAELLSVVLDGKRRGSVAFSLLALFNAVDQVKDLLSADTQRILNDLRDTMERLPENLRGGFHSIPGKALDTLVTTLLALAGLAHESMPRGQGWHFLDMGRRIERTLQTVSLLRSLWVPVVSAEDECVMLECVLTSAEALKTYRRRYQRDMDIASGLDALLLDDVNPRAVIYQLNELNRHMSAIPAAADGSRISQEQRLLLEATTSLSLADVQQLARSADGDYLRGELDQLLSRIQYLVSQTATALSDKYFDHSGGPQPMTRTQREPQP